MTEEVPPILTQTRIYQPTYRLNPKVKFNVEKVDKMLKGLVTSELEEVEYSDKVIPEICLTLADMIKHAIKNLNYDR